ncbi:hypothetical protein PR048_018991 [Dryococelus australis]|uniref:Uncharacterized protein n=1 Tax=Dryococelus australis TaxID=614101 RepID=A0ABQ9H285_9NEOP|nr:hypothetical protein PR048_018991 [Dryococelus australis]
MALSNAASKTSRLFHKFRERSADAIFFGRHRRDLYGCNNDGEYSRKAGFNETRQGIRTTLVEELLLYYPPLPFYLPPSSPPLPFFYYTVIIALAREKPCKQAAPGASRRKLTQTNGRRAGVVMEEYCVVREGGGEEDPSSPVFSFGNATKAQQKIGKVAQRTTNVCGQSIVSPPNDVQSSSGKRCIKKKTVIKWQGLPRRSHRGALSTATARQFSASRVGAMREKMRMYRSPLALPRFQASAVQNSFNQAATLTCSYHSVNVCSKPIGVAAQFSNILQRISGGRTWTWLCQSRHLTTGRDVIASSTQKTHALAYQEQGRGGRGRARASEGGEEARSFRCGRIAVAYACLCRLPNWLYPGRRQNTTEPVACGEVLQGKLVLAQCCTHTLRTQQEPVTRVGPGETECTAATHERAARHPLHTCCDLDCTTTSKWPMQPMRVKRGEYGAVPECKGGGNGRPPGNPPPDQRHIGILLHESRVRKSGHDPAVNQTRRVVQWHACEHGSRTDTRKIRKTAGASPNCYVPVNPSPYQPPRSPDLNPLDFYLWAHLKARAYEIPVDDLGILRNRICEVPCITQMNAAMAFHSNMIQPAGHTLYVMYYGIKPYGVREPRLIAVRVAWPLCHSGPEDGRGCRLGKWREPEFPHPCYHCVYANNSPSSSNNNNNNVNNNNNNTHPAAEANRFVSARRRLLADGLMVGRRGAAEAATGIQIARARSATRNSNRRSPVFRNPHACMTTGRWCSDKNVKARVPLPTRIQHLRLPTS